MEKNDNISSDDIFQEYENSNDDDESSIKDKKIK